MNVTKLTFSSRIFALGRPWEPRHYFDLVWFIPFIVACGNIQQDGWTLHQTYYGNDLGGVNNAGGNAAQQAQHRLRIHRLYNVLLNHIVVECATTVTISPEILNKITYPHIPTALERRNAYKSKKEVKEVAEDVCEEVVEEEIHSSDEEGQYANLLAEEHE